MPARLIPVVALFIAGFAHAQIDRPAAYPTKPLRIICNAAPGGVPDMVARLIADELTASLGQAVIVENRPGASGTIAIAQLAKAAPDGYTIATVSPPHTAAPSMMPNLPYDTLRDLVPVRQVSSATYFVLVRTSPPYGSLADIVTKAKAQPGALAYASSGIASPPHLVAEQGFADFDVRDWQGFVAPAGTPKAIVDRIAVEIGRTVDHPDVKNRLVSMGMEAATESSPEAFGALFRAEYARWAKVVKEAGIRME